MDGRTRLIKLSETEHGALEKAYKTGKRAVFRQRCHFVLLSDQGPVWSAQLGIAITSDHVSDFIPNSYQI